MVDNAQKNKPNQPILTGPVGTLKDARRSNMQATITRAKVIVDSEIRSLPDYFNSICALDNT